MKYLPCITMFLTGRRPRTLQDRARKEKGQKIGKEALQTYALGTRLRKAFFYGRGRSKKHEAEVMGSRDGYWRIHEEDGDKEDMNCRDMTRWVAQARRQ